MQAQLSQNTGIAVYGKVKPGWYVAATTWDASTAQHWRDIGYAVERCEFDRHNRPEFPSYKPDYAKVH